MKAISERKRTILSVRLTDNELGELHQVMAAKKMSASDLLREALLSISRQAPRSYVNSSSAASAS